MEFVQRILRKLRPRTTTTNTFFNRFLSGTNSKNRVHVNSPGTKAATRDNYNGLHITRAAVSLSDSLGN